MEQGELMATTTVQDAIDTIRSGDYATAQEQLAEVIVANPSEVQAWYLLSQLVDSDARRAAYLSKTLALDPYHQRAWAEFYALPADVISRLDPNQMPTTPEDRASEAQPSTPLATAPPIAVAAASAPTTTAAAGIDLETALPDWLRPVAKDQPVVAQRRPATAAPAAPPDVSTTPPADTTPVPDEGNRSLSVLLVILLIATLAVLAFLVYLLLQG